MIIASYQPIDYQTVAEVLARGICMARSGRPFSYLDRELKQRNLMTRYHLRTIRVQGRINGKIKLMNGEELAEHVSSDGIRLHMNVSGVPVKVTEKSALGSLMVQYKRNKKALNAKIRE